MAAVTYPLEVDKSPSDEFSLKNCAVVNSHDQLLSPGTNYCKVLREMSAGAPKAFYITLGLDPKMARGKMGLSNIQREWLGVRLKEVLQVHPITIPKESNLIATISVELDFFVKPKKAVPAINTDDFAPWFARKFTENVFCEGQQLVCAFEKLPLFRAKVLKMTAENTAQLRGIPSSSSSTAPKTINYGILHSNSRVIFEKKPDSSVQLIGRSKGDSAHRTLISPDWDFKQMGIGGLDKEFSDIFRRAFASRVFPPDLVEQLGMKHVRGILLFGPPGTGKTLMARQIGKMLNSVEPKIVDGPEVLNKYVGESEANIRNLFGSAETDQKKLGINSPLHIIIFDEIDAICRTRGSLSGSTGVHDTVVNQLLAKIDGVEQLNNILLIGMTNRKDMIDEALLRPGRLEVQMEIGLPDENGRLEILSIHTAHMQRHNKLASNVDLAELAARSRNFSGAELEGLVRSAQATAMNRIIKAKDKVTVSYQEADKLKVTMADFNHALQFDLKPAFGISEEQLENFVLNGIIPWTERVQDILDLGKAVVRQTRESQRSPLVSLLLRGGVSCGKTALAAYIAKLSEFPFVKVITPENMIGFSEGAKCQAVKKVFEDAYKSELSCIVIDDIERLLDYTAIGPRFSNLVLQALLVLLRKQPPISTSKIAHKLLIIGTTGFDDDVLDLTGIRGAFDNYISVPNLSRGEEALNVLGETALFSWSDRQMKLFHRELDGKRLNIGVKKFLSMIEASRLSGEQEECVRTLIGRLKAEAMLK